MTDLSGALGGAVGQTLGGVAEILNGALGGATQVVAQAGDTLGSIADAHGVPLSSVVAANPQVLHPDLVQPGQAITVPQGGADPQGAAVSGPPTTSAPADPGLAQSAVQTLGQAVQPLGAAVARTAQAAGRVMDAAVAPGALGTADSAAAGRAADAGAPSRPGGVASDAPAGARPESPTSFAPAGADFRVLAQAAPPVAQPVGGPAATLAGAPALMQALARIDPALAQLLASALAAPTLGAPSNPAQIAKLEAALLSLGWSAASLGLAKPGDVVLLLRAAALQAARVPPAGLAALMSEVAGPLSAHPDPDPPRALSPPPAAPTGVDAQAPPRLRRAPADPGADRAGKSQDGGRKREAEASPQRAWIERALPAAMAVKAKWGVPAAVTIAQGALASDWGRLAPGNDFFGLADRPGVHLALPAPAGRALLPSPAASLAFGDMEEAADAFGAVLRGTPGFALAFRAADAATFARRLGEAGFAPDPAYGRRLADLIDAYDLAALDA